MLTLETAPDSLQDLLVLNAKAWPEFMLHWECKAWAHLFTSFAAYQLLWYERDELVAFAHSLPLYWGRELVALPDDLRTLVELAVEGRTAGLRPNLLLALAVVVAPEQRDRGLSREALMALKALGTSRGLAQLVVPLRPTRKAQHPFVAIEEYASWQREDGLPFDPWLRTHQRLGGEVFKTARTSMVIRGTLQEWEAWTGRRLTTQGIQSVAGALAPVEIDLDQDLVVYREPCIWVRHAL